jgi:predicted CopG family antitoxin
MTITIKISKDLQKELIKRKKFDDDSFEDIIWDLIENTMELSDKTKKKLIKARAEIKTGKTYSLAQVKKRFRL